MTESEEKLIPISPTFAAMVAKITNPDDSEDTAPPKRGERLVFRTAAGFDIVWPNGLPE